MWARKGHALASESLGSGDEELYAVCSGRQLDTKASLLRRLLSTPWRVP